MADNILGTKKLTNENGNQLYPVTTTDSVYVSDSTTGQATERKLSEELADKLDRLTGSTVGNIVTVGSDGTIEDSGLSSSDFASDDQAVPSGGTTGQVLTKQSDTDNDVIWTTPQSGGDTCVSTTYSELVALRDGGELSPGTWYRITDYVTTTTQEGTQSANHAFDIIVRADDASHLNENAFATHHSGDTYFSNCHLESWELKYCLDNDAGMFVWADGTNGKGVVYYMKDEWGNEAPFDFKNMLFTRDSEWFNGNQQWAEDVLGEVPEAGMHFYFLSWVNEDGEVEDASIVGQTLLNDEGYYSGVYDNKIGVTNAYYMGLAEDATSTAFALPCTIIVSSYAYEDGVFYGCYSNTFGNNCQSNSFGNGCGSNTFGNYCGGNEFGNNCQSNSFGNGCFLNTFGNECGGNTFGNNCNNNSFGDGCDINTFGNNCLSNTFGNYCGGNEFGDGCGSNTFGNGCGSNEVGGGCSGNTLGNDCGYNSFGNICNNNSFGNYCQNITVFDGVQYCSVTGGASNAPVRNAQILNGTAGISSDNKLTITFDANAIYTQVAGIRKVGGLNIFVPAGEVPPT